MGEILPMSREKHYEVTSFMLLHDKVIPINGQERES
jgi:hypothetical protein